MGEFSLNYAISYYSMKTPITISIMGMPFHLGSYLTRVSQAILGFITGDLGSK